VGYPRKEWDKSKKKISEKNFKSESCQDFYGDNKSVLCNRGRDPL